MEENVHARPQEGGGGRESARAHICMIAESPSGTERFAAPAMVASGGGRPRLYLRARRCPLLHLCRRAAARRAGKGRSPTNSPSTRARRATPSSVRLSARSRARAHAARRIVCVKGSASRSTARTFSIFPASCSGTACALRSARKRRKRREKMIVEYFGAFLRSPDRLGRNALRDRPVRGHRLPDAAHAGGRRALHARGTSTTHNIAGVAGEPKVIESVGSFTCGGVRITGIASFHDRRGRRKTRQKYHLCFGEDGDTRVCPPRRHRRAAPRRPAAAQRSAKVDLLFVPRRGNVTRRRKGRARIYPGAAGHASPWPSITAARAARWISTTNSRCCAWRATAARGWAASTFDLGAMSRYMGRIVIAEGGRRDAGEWSSCWSTAPLYD